MQRGMGSVGEKTHISNGGIADIYIVFARTGEAPGAKGISAFLLPADTPGLEIVDRIEVMAPHPLAHLRFSDIHLPEHSLISQSGQGFNVAMSVLDVFRSTVGAAALGMARRALGEAVARVKSRQVQGGPLAELQMVQGHIADMAVDVDLSALAVYRAAWVKDTVGVLNAEMLAADMLALSAGNGFPALPASKLVIEYGRNVDSEIYDAMAATRTKVSNRHTAF